MNISESVCVFSISLWLTLLLNPSVFLQTLMTATQIRARMEELVSMRSTPLSVFVCPATVVLHVKKVTVGLNY